MSETLCLFSILERLVILIREQLQVCPMNYFHYFPLCLFVNYLSSLAPGATSSPSMTVSSNDTSGQKYRDLAPRKQSLDDVKMYTLANIMSDKSPTHPDTALSHISYTYGLSQIDRLDDPLQAEFVTEAEVDQLFYSCVSCFFFAFPACI
jgi:hypothetical protein